MPIARVTYIQAASLRRTHPLTNTSNSPMRTERSAGKFSMGKTGSRNEDEGYEVFHRMLNVELSACSIKLYDGLLEQQLDPVA
jgi:hypothetical protein